MTLRLLSVRAKIYMEFDEQSYGALKLPIWELPMPPVWFWVLVLGIIVLFIYLLKGFLEAEEEYVQPSVGERLRWKIIRLKLFEIIAWIFIPIGFILYVYGIVNSSHFIIFLIASCLMIVGYVVAIYYRKQRLTFQEELKEKQQS